MYKFWIVKFINSNTKSVSWSYYQCPSAWNVDDVCDYAESVKSISEFVVITPANKIPDSYLSWPHHPSYQLN